MMATISKSQLYSARLEMRRLPSQRAELSGYDRGFPLVPYREPPEKCVQKGKRPSSSAQKGQTSQKVGLFVLCSERVNRSKKR
jgi:hypothetical protein